MDNAQEKRIANIFDQEEIPYVMLEHLMTYHDFLSEKLEPMTPLIITDGHKTGQVCKFYTLDDFVDENYGLLARVNLTDAPVIPLVDLRVTDERSAMSPLIDDYATWFANWQ